MTGSLKIGLTGYNQLNRTSIDSVGHRCYKDVNVIYLTQTTENFDDQENTPS